MKNNFKQTVTDAIAKTQDGGMKGLLDNDDFSQFILARIDHNSSGGEVPHIEVDDLISDFKYMINQLKSALRPLEGFMERWPNQEIPEDTKFTPVSDDDMQTLMCMK